MPTSFASLLVLVLAILPGVPGEAIYRFVLGADWRDKQWQRVLRILLFSVIGLVAYAIIASSGRVPSPVFLDISTYKLERFDKDIVLKAAESLGAHFIASSLVGFFSALAVLFLNKLFKKSIYPDAYTTFINNCADFRWVVVTLTSGSSYAGYILRGDTSVAFGERDIILAEPAQYNQETKQYQCVSYQHMYLSAGMIASIATVYDPTIDKKRQSPIEGNLFECQGPAHKEGEKQCQTETRKGKMGSKVVE